MYTTIATSMMETDVPTNTKGIVIFGATGDLCKRKLIPALHKLWEKGLPQRTSLLLVLLGENQQQNNGNNLWEIIPKNFFGIWIINVQIYLILIHYKIYQNMMM